MSEAMTVEQALQHIGDRLTFPKTGEDFRIVHDAMQSLRAALPRWIPMEERLPEGNCLVYLASPSVSGQIQGANYAGGVATIGGHFAFDMPKVTHWMPLPAAPTQEEQE